METNTGIRIEGLHQVAQRATDVDRAAAFYCDMFGARLLGTFDPPGIAFVDMAGTRLLFEASASSATLYFRVADLQGAYATLTARGVTFEAPPQLVHRDDTGQFGPPGNEEWMAFLRDTEGNLVGLAERRAPA